MKIRRIFFFLVLLAFSCEKDDKLAFEYITYLGDTCDGCPNIRITAPKALADSKIDKVVNNAIKEEIIYLLDFNEENDATDIESAVHSFTKGYTDLKHLFVDEPMTWEATITGSISYEDDTVLTIKLESYLFTGGAHGYQTIHYLNFNKTKAIALDGENLFKNTSDFEEYAESKFRKQEGIPEKGDINSTGFMFETGSFYLPQNIGYTQKGIELFYEQYEIASYADGPIVLTFPYPELQKYLAHVPKPK
ncbi:DUF3298 domain-containing protein [Maribacter chungangensis]|uniref:DUF3298 domain-containing protein n=1 Tax=Maribacter chungangensis TaxID=1069117 RepID=A0ABW3B8H9_9FLAO